MQSLDAEPGCRVRKFRVRKFNSQYLRLVENISDMRHIAIKSWYHFKYISWTLMIFSGAFATYLFPDMHPASSYGAYRAQCVKCVSSPWHVKIVFDSTELPLMTFGFECQHCSSRGAMASQLSNLPAPFNKHACVNNFPLFQATRHNGQWKPTTAHTRSDHKGNNVRWIFLTQTFSKYHDCHFIGRGYESPHMMHLENTDMGIWYELFQIKLRFFIKGCD